MIRPLAEVFGELKDPRRAKGKWHDFGATMTMIFLAILSGEQGIRGVAAWIQEQRWRLGRQFKLKNSRVPSYGTIRRTLAAVDVSELEQGLGRWADEDRASLERGRLAGDRARWENAAGPWR